MDKLTYLELAEKVLNEVHSPLSPSEIWKYAVGKSYQLHLTKQGKTPERTLYGTIFVDARDNHNSKFKKLGTRPARYYLRKHESEIGKDFEPIAADAQQGTTAAEIAEKSGNYKEGDLHSLLVYFCDIRFNAHAKTIKHNLSNKKEFGEWVHPDLIGVYYPFKDLSGEVVNLSKAMGETAVRLYSFEIKKQLNFSNLREAFFQGVSNSSWAHEGYLVAAEIDNVEEFEEELRRLSASFGIGIIELDLEDPVSSIVKVPARKRDVLDWNALNKLASLNPDVKKLLITIKNALTTDYVYQGEYDALETREALIQKFKALLGTT